MKNKFFHIYFLFYLFKVTNHSCTVHDKFQSAIRDCYGSYSPSKEDRRTYGPANPTTTPNAYEKIFRYDIY